MLRVNKLTDYAIEIMAIMADEPKIVVSANEIAKKTNLSTTTVSKILKILAKENLLLSSRGSEGGYCLATSPNLISIAKIIKVMEGELALTECNLKHNKCEHLTHCSIKTNWRKINTAILDALEAINISVIRGNLPINCTLKWEGLNFSSNEPNKKSLAFFGDKNDTE